jgi:hypothetical protein
MGGIVATLFTGNCALDGHSQAPMDGFMASSERGGYNPVDVYLNISDNQKIISILL